ncbi:Low-affinity inorganic phosphate transporter 1 [Escherichia coli H605]|uniref:Low-affinity inorganic phosphate transporter 1 n=1 Tax=Escherichia coli H605 TaxID=656410 RepID=A0AAJ3NVZ1_ECOLX|nr:Low-affinity inorganic phosphate transporter 1 [Escherichia coli H605]
MSKNHTGGKSKKSIFHFARAAKVTDNAPRSCPQNGVTSYATFVCWPGFAYRAVIIACTGFCAVLRSH